MPPMDTPSQHPIDPQDGTAAAAVPAAWTELLEEMRVLHARLEYLRLMLRLGIPLPPA